MQQQQKEISRMHKYNEIGEKEKMSRNPRGAKHSIDFDRLIFIKSTKTS